MPVLPIEDIDVLDVENMSKEEFEKQWIYRPVRVRGVLDNQEEVLIQRPNNGEKGLQVVTPLYTGEKDGNLKGLFIDRGWLAQDLSNLKAHHDGNGRDPVYIEGVVIYGEGKSFTGKNNDEINKIRIDLEEFMPRAQFSNRKQALSIMIKEINFSIHQGAETGRALKRATPADLCYWYVTPERH